MPDQIVDLEKLHRLADAYNVATEFWGFHGEHVRVEAQTLMTVLAAMGVDARTDQAIEAALIAKDEEPWRQILPTCVVTRDDREHSIAVHVPHGWDVELRIVFEDGTERIVRQGEDFTPPRVIEGHTIGQASFILDAGLPLGYHKIYARVSHAETDNVAQDSTTLIVTPGKLSKGSLEYHRSWGMMAQLYSTRSAHSWGVGDADDLLEMSSLFGSKGADYLLVNPLHAAEPIEPLSPSPYLPVTRRFFNPMYIRPENIREVAYLSGPERSLITWAGETVKKESLKNSHIDRDAAWKAKREALEVIFTAGRSQSREREFAQYRHNEGQGLEDFALWCALVEHYQGQEFPQELHDVNSRGVAQARVQLRDRIDFWAWLQWIMDEQLADAQRAAKASGMAFGIAHDLAVGVHPQGSDTWTIPEAFAHGVGVGAPPDMYNQQGQNWSQPPWRPDALQKMDYTPLRDMARTVMRHAGLLRVDHVMGLFRLWWVPDGMPANQGTYVRFDHEAMVGVLLLEAYRAGAVLIGEDLGNVEPWVREYLRERGIWGTSIFWFEKDGDGAPLRAENYRSDALVSVDTHDLPPAAGYLAQEHVSLRARLGLLVEPEEKVRAEAYRELETVYSRLREYGLIGPEPSERELVEAMHVYLTRTPAPLLCISLVDAVGERRAQNQPGTDQEYPNWKIPLADGTEKVVLVEELAKNPRLLSLVDAFTKALNGSE
ncbi:4-alpha-glucanotransferase [Arcanobacterium phocisimile]|uniref:4-alpha-glucanotransferase n=1 Tax=Arcanobacterium phocisimile TaxID=1302235 RepID=A0ABX7IHK6_9ACTO|nr:4-alpha-glucanotransferase [Arcanobacterium phocisimile]QRV02606.1 4-alpha-glucanotransferase [Arcanobacterium phocisimile]